MPVRFSFERSARAPRAMLAVLAWWSVIGLLWGLLDAAPLLLLLLGAASLPALYDLGANAKSGLTITERDFSWVSGRAQGHLPRAQLARVRLDTRLDLSLRMTLITHQGERLRLPDAAVPPAAQITQALEAEGIAVERHHFSLL